ncbi:MAG: hypothetical protein C4562_02045 [Actinobacteria bacterium]|nr:MAG: hypothetical protein C4562_02045 [Actinomycetota bacterium]
MNYILIGCLLGISAAITPGPLTALIIAQTIKGSLKNGIMVALSPIFSDLLIAPVIMLILAKIPEKITNILSVIGGMVVIFYGISTIYRRHIETKPTSTQSLYKGILINISNPHPYIFWSAIAGPLTIKAYEISVILSISFIAAFYFVFIGLAIGLVYLVHKGKDLFHSKYYQYALIACGAFMIAIGVYLIFSGLT